MPTLVHDRNLPMLSIETIKLKLKFLPEENVLDDFYGSNLFLWKSFFKSALNLVPSWLGVFHFIFFIVIFVKEVFDNIIPVGRKVPLLKISKFYCQQLSCVQVIPACDLKLIVVWDLGLMKWNSKTFLTDFIKVFQVLTAKLFDGWQLWEVVFVIFKHLTDFFLCKSDQLLGACYHDLVI